MTSARWTALTLLASVLAVLGLYWAGVDPAPLSLWVVGIGAPALTTFVFLYAVTVPWQNEWITRALMVSSIGTAGLIDLALLNRVLPPNYFGQQELLLTVLVFMSAGGFLKLVALLVDKVPAWVQRRAQAKDSIR